MLLITRTSTQNVTLHIIQRTEEKTHDLLSRLIC